MLPQEEKKVKSALVRTMWIGIAVLALVHCVISVLAVYKTQHMNLFELAMSISVGACGFWALWAGGRK